MFELFTDAASAVLRHAVDEALSLHAKEVEPVHLLLGIMDDDDGIAATVLQGDGVGRQSVLRELDLTESTASAPHRFHNRLKGGAIQYSGASELALKAAEEQAKQLQSPTISAGHLLLGLLEADDMKKLVGALGAGADSIGSTVKARLRDAG
ncbi:Clp protease N-terminal domain-containing protein [Arthrobacter sp.]|uniref:Clp protease N-terminal domain-containing protein n=1 Tax=Arthrobacter sp. TaxID=1667 RepID=UPI002585E17F|nr:Clp protease N-terminal domain-containing protein [Arthrobacter sp.]